ncbi:MAG: Maf family nucleotide pyrophosphatase [Lentimicrobium sp.]|nr:Maf family nucleotide pyrophosphatase [Lentimicrobium sp.]
MQNPLKDYPFNVILASQSPRRQTLLRETGLDFEILVKPTDESYPDDLQAEEIALHVSRIKAQAFDLNEFPDHTLIITADTIVWLNGECIGKPADEEDAVKMLSKLSGRKHTVCTGVCLKSKEKYQEFFVNTDVYFRKLTEAEIRYYVAHFRPFDKAGAYGIQEWIGFIGVEKIEGSYFNVMGLPVQRLYCELLSFAQGFRQNG